MNNNNYIFVDNQSKLENMVQDLEANERIGLDTESNSLHAYFEQICLIQISSNDHLYLVDPFADINLAPLLKVLKNPKIEKIIHAAEYDLMCILRDYNVRLKNVFDTMEAAQLLGFSKVGLASLLEFFYDIQLAKKYQKADWGERPLKPQMLDYAIMDVKYLISLRNKLYKMLEKDNKLELALEDNKRNAEKVLPGKRSHNVDVWKMKGNRGSGLRELTVMQALVEGRDVQARKRNVPPFKIISDKDLRILATSQPISSRDYQSIDNISRRVLDRNIPWIRKGIEQGRTQPLVPKPKRKPDINGAQEKSEAIRAWRKSKAAELSMDSSSVLPRDVMRKVIVSKIDHMEHLRKVMEDVPVRYRKFGEEIFEAITNL